MLQVPDADRLKPAHGVLIIANSGRMLATMARSSGYMPLIIDLFADEDTETVAEKVWQVEDLSLPMVQQAIEDLLCNYKIQWLMYGSGLENHPETLEYLSHRYPIIGNDYAVIKQLNIKKIFFQQLDALEIDYPEVQFYAPDNRAAWLIKPMKHLGGLGIRYCDRQIKENEYYQKFFQGEAGSILFCADGEGFELIGFHRQWTIAQNNFTFAGIIKTVHLPEECQKTVCNWLHKLVKFYHLKGLASMDFLHKDNNCVFLEINPRPSVSIMLYPELDLLNAHITGHLTTPVVDKSIRALQIIYAQQACQIRAEFEWPWWSIDRPKCHTNIPANHPMCSIMAQGKTTEQTIAQLRARQTYIENIFFNG